MSWWQTAVAVVLAFFRRLRRRERDRAVERVPGGDGDRVRPAARPRRVVGIIPLHYAWPNGRGEWAASVLRRTYQSELRNELCARGPVGRRTYERMLLGESPLSHGKGR